MKTSLGANAYLLVESTFFALARSTIVFGLHSSKVKSAVSGMVSPGLLSPAA
jgi:hypothetical protein